MTTTQMRRRLSLIDQAQAISQKPLDRTVKAFLGVDDVVLIGKWKTWDNALYLASNGDTKAVQNAIDENLALDPMHELFNETF